MHGVGIKRRIATGGVLIVVAAVVAITAAGLVAATAGAELPNAVGAALSAAGNVLGWARIVIVAVLAAGVLQARE